MSKPRTALQQATRWWRPVFAWCFIIGWSLTLLVILFLLVIQVVTLTDAAGILMVLVGSGAAPMSLFTYGRTQEKIEGVGGPTNQADDQQNPARPPAEEE